MTEETMIEGTAVIQIEDELTKPGPHTTEFWTTLIMMVMPWLVILVVLGMVWSGAVTLEEATPILVALGLGGGFGGGIAAGQYSRSRALVKTGGLG